MYIEMSDVSKVGAAVPPPVNRAIPPKTSKSDGGSEKAAGSEAAAQTFRLPEGLAGPERPGQPLTAREALEAVLQGLSQKFAALGENPPASGAALEDLLGEIKLAAPVLDRVLSARNDELLAAGDTEGLAALEATLADAQAKLDEARADLEAAAAALPDEQATEDPELAAALNAVLGAGREIPAFSADEIREGRQEFIGLVFDDIADAISRHRGSGAQVPSFVLANLGGTSLTA